MSGNPSLADGSNGRPNSTILRLMVGAQLRRYREARGITPEQAAAEIQASQSKISRMETGRVGFKLRDVHHLLTFYGVHDRRARDETLALARQASTPGWWAQYNDVVPDWFEAYLGMEAAASLIRSFECQFVTALFQTEDYARAVSRLRHPAVPGEEIDRRARMLVKRQDLLSRPSPPQLWSVMDEAVLRRLVGGPGVMRGQLQRLLDIAGLPRVTLQVVPFRRGGHAAVGGAFAVLRFAEPDVPDAVYIEHLTSAVYLGKRTDVEHYLEVMNVLSAQALNPATTARFIRQVIEET